MATLTVPGGQNVTAFFCDDELTAAQQALATLEQGFQPGNIQVLTSTVVSPMPMPGVLYLFNVSSGGTITPPFGHYGTILSDDTANATISASGSQVLVIGNNHDNLINITGGGVMYTADGGEYIGSGTVISGAGNDTINVKGDATVFACDGNDSITVQLGNANITVGTGNDTISFGGPNDTVTAAGSSTVTGPAGIHATVVGGQLVFHGSPGGANESVTAGSGDATLLGGSGLTFIGGTGNVLMQGTVGGGGNDTYFGGSGNDSMVAGHGAGGNLGNVFNFDTGATPEGGQHTVYNFVQQDTISSAVGADKIHLGAGYNVANILNGSDVNNGVTYGSGNAVLSLDNGATKVTFIGVTKLNPDDFS
jgi:Ca2+-binding RTX toxin-like protein